MNTKTQNKIGRHIITDFQKYGITTMEAIGLLESIKLSLFNDSIKKVCIDMDSFTEKEYDTEPDWEKV
jgi:hypothetical protein